jgi:hypothetical protein
MKLKNESHTWYDHLPFKLEADLGTKVNFINIVD